MNISIDATGARIADTGDFSLERTLESGQCFRFVRDNDAYLCAAGSHTARITQDGDTLYFEGVGDMDEALFWADYFDLGRDYGEINEFLSKTDANVADAIKSCPGIHILKQEPWETLCSFIISQNNNIPRIKKIVLSLCSLFGDEIGNGFFSFPAADVIARAGVEALSPIRAGFRNKYIFDAACRVADGDIDLTKVASMELESAVGELKRIKGVGDKVASCALLFGFGMLDAFPVDVWVKKVIGKYYGDTFEPRMFAPYAGVAQQYLFFRERSL